MVSVFSTRRPGVFGNMLPLPAFFVKIHLPRSLKTSRQKISYDQPHSNYYFPGLSLWRLLFYYYFSLYLNNLTSKFRETHNRDTSKITPPLIPSVYRNSAGITILGIFSQESFLSRTTVCVFNFIPPKVSALAPPPRPPKEKRGQSDDRMRSLCQNPLFSNGIGCC